MSFLAEIVAKVVAALLAFWSGERQRRENATAREELGAARAEAAGRREAAERVAAARVEEAKADAAHAKKSDDDAFDPEFRRDA